MFIKAVLVGLVGIFCRLDSRLLGRLNFERPLIGSTLVGLVLGDLHTGLVVGAQLELVSLGILSVGAAAPPDMETCFDEYNFYDYKWNKTPIEDPEWAYMLNRHGFLYDLSLIYAITKEEKYLDKWKEYLFDFIKDNNDVEDIAKNYNAWRPLDIGIRLSNWMKSLQYINYEEELSQTEKELFIDSINFQIQQIVDTYDVKYDLSNWGVLALTGVAACFVLLPHLIVREKYLNWVLEKLDKQLSMQFYEDNIHWEQSPLYHHEVSMSYLYLYNFERLLNIKLLENLKERVKKIIEVTYYYIDNSDVLLSLNDSDTLNFQFVYDYYRSLGMINDKDPNYDMSIFVGEIEKKDIKMYDKIFFGSQSGLMVQKKKDSYFTAFNGSHGSSHGHASNGSITLDINDVKFIVDPARYSYYEVEERFYLKSEKAHNSLSVENFEAMKIKESWKYGSVTEPLLNNFVKWENGWMFEMSWYSVDNILYRRNVIYFDDLDFYVIYDKVNGISKNQVLNKYFQIHPDVNIDILKEKIQLKSKNEILNLWTLDNKILIEDSLYSDRYNLLQKNKKIVITPNYIDEVRDSITILSKNDLVVSEKKVKQNKKDSSMNLMKSIEVKNETTTYQILFGRKPVTSGDKVFVTDENISVYGQLNIIKNNDIIFRLK